MRPFAALRLLRLGAAAIVIGSSGCGSLSALWGDDPPAPPAVRRLVPVTNRYDTPAPDAAAGQKLTYIVESHVLVRDVEPPVPSAEEERATEIVVVPADDRSNPRDAVRKASLGHPVTVRPE
jgi:hypothetical protein